MQLITITGGRTLHGRIRPAAAKNSVLPLLAATLLCRTPSRLRAVPPLADVATSLALLQSVGAKAEQQGSDLFVAPGQDLQGEIPDYLAGAGTPVVVIQGGKPLQGTAWTPLPDRIAAATYAAALACAGGEVTVTHCAPAYYAAFLDFLQAAGVDVARQDTTVTLARSPARPLRGGQTLCANAWPAFATDTAPLAAAVLLTADAPSEIYDHLFARRFACAEGFTALGARCRTAGRTLYMDGRAALHGAAVTAPDLRGGAALLLAALGAEGVTLLRDPGHIPRGYADLPGDLRTLGADCITEKT